MPRTDFRRLTELYSPANARTHRRKREFGIVLNELRLLEERGDIRRLKRLAKLHDRNGDLYEAVTGVPGSPPELGILKNLMGDDEDASLRIGEEFIVSETKDLFYSAFFEYLKKVHLLFSEGLRMMNGAGMDPKKSISVVQAGSGGWTLRVHHRKGIEEVEDIQEYFKDAKGKYNAKGYYDAQTVTRINRVLFPVFDRILDSSAREELSKDEENGN